MRRLLAVLALTNAGWSEFGASTRMRNAEQLVESSCDLDVTLRGAIATIELRQQLTNPGAEALGATRDFELPRDAQLVGLEWQRAGAKAEAALAVRQPFTTDRAGADGVVGADPVMVSALDVVDSKPRFRVIVQPIEHEQTATIITRWTQIATIRGGALRLMLPGQDFKCRGTLHALPGPGTSIARVRAGGSEISARSFTLGSRDIALDVELAFKRDEPVVWTQTEKLGEGFTAQAITVLAPATKALTAKRALFVIDGSRSMELVGRHNVKAILHSVGSALPTGTQIEAILYDRTAARVLGAWQPVDTKQLAAIENALGSRIAGNGSDAAAALALAKQAIGTGGGDTLIVHVTDGVLGDEARDALAQAIAPSGRDELDLHAIVLSPGKMRSPDTEPIRRAIDRVGGSYVEVAVDDLDSALANLDEWIRPAWQNLAGAGDVGDQLYAGAGIVLTSIVKQPAKPTLTGRLAAKTFKATATRAPEAPIAELALARAKPDAVGGDFVYRKLRLRHPSVDTDHALVVLASGGKVERSRREVAAAGGPFTRMVAIADPTFPPVVRIGTATRPGGSAIDRDALKLLFRTYLQPAAYTCYQKAIARSPKLAGTAQFRLEIGRGETTRAQVTGLGDATFDACLLDAAYKVTPSLPNPTYNIDDRTIANYPLTFSVREDKPYVIPGDADSSTPLDIEAIQGGVPVKVKAGDTSTPLGNLKVPEH